jgi:hypothetical protein
MMVRSSEPRAGAHPPPRSQGGPVSGAAPDRDNMHMSTFLRRLRDTVNQLGAESRPDFKRIDASPALYDDGSWLTPKTA